MIDLDCEDLEFIPPGEWDEDRCLSHEHDYSIVAFNTKIAVAVCVKCRNVSGGWWKND